MNLAILLGTLFLAFTFGSWITIAFGRELFRKHRRAITENIDRSLQNQFVFTNAGNLFLLHVGLMIILPAVFLWLEFPWFICLLSIVVIMYTPRAVFFILQVKRRNALVASLPDSLQQMGSSLKAGSTFNAAVDALVSERDGPISQELSLVLREQRLGIRLEESLENLGERVKSEDIDIVISAILIAQEVGGNLAEVLTRLADTLRKKITMEDRIRSLTAQGVMQGYVVTALPTFIVIALLLLERDAISPLFTSLLGWMFLVLIISLQACGGWFIRKVVKIEI